MEKKLKITILALAVFLAISIFFIFSVQTSKLALLREYSTAKEKLIKENEEFSKKVVTALAEGKELQNKLGLIQAELERMSTGKIELQRKYELANKEKAELLQKLEEQAKAKSIEKAQPKLEAKAPTPITEDAYWAEVLRTKADLELQVKGLNKKLIESQKGNQQLQNEKTSWELKITSLNQEKQELERKLQYNERLLDSISTEMVHEKNKIHQLQKDLAALKEENKDLRVEVKRLDRQRLAFAEKLSNLLEEKERLAARVDQAELTLNEKVSQMERMHHEFEELLKKVRAESSSIEPTKESVDLPPIVVSSSPEYEVSKPISLEGKILTVDEAHNFIVIDLGKANGVNEDMLFEVYREDKLLGKVGVIQLREEIAACDIIQADIPFKIGDSVKY